MWLSACKDKQRVDDSTNEIPSVSVCLRYLSRRDNSRTDKEGRPVRWPGAGEDCRRGEQRAHTWNTVKSRGRIGVPAMCIGRTCTDTIHLLFYAILDKARLARATQWLYRRQDGQVKTETIRPTTRSRTDRVCPTTSTGYFSIASSKPSRSPGPSCIIVFSFSSHLCTLAFSTYRSNPALRLGICK